MSVGCGRAKLSSFLGRRLYAASVKSAVLFVRLIVVRTSTSTTARLVALTTCLHLLLLLLLLIIIIVIYSFIIVAVVLCNFHIHITIMVQYCGVATYADINLTVTFIEKNKLSVSYLNVIKTNVNRHLYTTSTQYSLGY